MREFVGDYEREFVIGLREADETRGDVEVIAACAIGQHQIADFDEGLRAAGEKWLDGDADFLFVAQQRDRNRSSLERGGAIEEVDVGVDRATRHLQDLVAKKQ